MKYILFLFFLIFFTQTNVLALTLDLPKTIINPDKYLFFSIKRLAEKAIIYTKLSKKSKADYNQNLILKRMSELKYVVDSKLLGELERSTQRLSYQIGILSDFLSTNKKELTSNIKNTSDFLEKSKTLLAELRDKYPANSSYWMLVQHSINSIDLNLEKLK